ncbi:MAG: rhodanese-like domain-containing protein [bacterium]|nr:rhodanese-like domain-containing protein [bacterium]
MINKLKSNIAKMIKKRHEMKSVCFAIPIWLVEAGQKSFICFILCILFGCVNRTLEPSIPLISLDQIKYLRTGNSKLPPDVMYAFLPDSQKYRDILADELKGMLDRNETFLLVDVRTSKEYAKGCIGKAINIPYIEMKDKVTDVKNKARALG